MSRTDGEMPQERHYVIAKDDLTAVQTLLQQGIITEAMAKVLREKVKTGDQNIRIYRGSFRILD